MRIYLYAEAALKFIHNVVLDDGTNVRRVTLANLRRAVSSLGIGLETTRGRAHLFEDFLVLPPSAAGLHRFVTAVTGTGAVTHVGAGAAPGSTEGLGWIKLATGGGAGTAKVADNVELIRAGMKPTHVARCKLPAVFADSTCEQGFENAAGTIYARLGTASDGKWVAQQASVAGGASQSVSVSSPLPVASAIVEVKIEVEPGVGSRFYVDGALIQTLSTAGAIPTAAETFGQFGRATRVASAGEFSIDRLEVEPDR